MNKYESVIIINPSVDEEKVKSLSNTFADLINKHGKVEKIEDLGKKKPVIKTGAEIPFTRYFYKYQQPIASEELEAKFSELELSVSERVAQLFE